MRRTVSFGVLSVLLTLLCGMGLAMAAAGTTKLVEGTVYDTTCGSACLPCPPPCGPIPVPQSRADVICAQTQRQIVCPLTNSRRVVAPDFCIEGQSCGVTHPVYSGEGAVVTLRKRGVQSFLAKIPVLEGHFRVRLSPGEYVIRPYLPEPQCWSGGPSLLVITPKLRSPVPAPVDVSNSCVAHPDAAR